jgi:hypothetical protein
LAGGARPGAPYWKAIHIPDVLADPEYRATRYQELAGYRSTLGVPLLRDGMTIGVFGLGRREPNPFTEKQIELVTTFADQAVIAIEKVRLFDDVQARSREVQESLEYQTAISDVLNVISRSPGALQPVLDTIVQTAARLCEAEFSSRLPMRSTKSLCALVSARGWLRHSCVERMSSACWWSAAARLGPSRRTPLT